MQKEKNSTEAFDHVVDKFAMKKTRLQTIRGIDPFRTTNSGKLFFIDRNTRNASNPNSIMDMGVLRYTNPV